MDQIVLTRQELYKLVWHESMLSLSKRFNISDVGLRKTCIRMNIPVPPAGYWAKIQFGKKVRQVPLSEQYNGDSTVKLTLRDKNNSGDNNFTLIRKLNKQEVETDTSVSLEIPEKLLKPDPLISLTKTVFAKQKPNNYDYIGIVSSTIDALDIRVAKSNVDRALIFFDTLIKVLKGRGHSVQINNRKTEAIINGENFQLSLREKMRKESVKDGSWTRQVFYPKGILALQVGGWGGREYKDGIIRLEVQLSKIIAGLELSAAQVKERELKFQKTEAERKERERLEQELEKSKEQELINFKKLLTNSERWHKAENLRKYIQELETRAEVNNGVTPELNEWLQWAKRKASWYDPFVETPDELFKDIDQNTLELPKKKTGYNWGY